MIETLLHNIQLIAFPLIFIYGMLFMFDPPPPEVCKTNAIARRLFGVIMFIWSLFIGATWFLDGDFGSAVINRSVNLCRYFIFGSLFEVIFSALVDCQYPIIQKIRNKFIHWGLYITALAINVLFVPENIQGYVIIVAAVYYAYEIVGILYRYYNVYYRMKRNLDNYYSENVSDYTRWMLNSSHGLSTMGLAAIGVAFAPPIGLLIFMICGVIFFTYMSYSLYRYNMSVGYIQAIVMLKDGKVVSEKELSDMHPPISEEANPTYIALGINIEEWIANHGYTTPAITIQQLAVELRTNRTYLSSYINTKYKLTFREWIAVMRIDYSKKILLINPSFSARKVAEIIGYSHSSFATIFAKQNRVSPTQWRNENLEETEVPEKKGE